MLLALTGGCSAAVFDTAPNGPEESAVLAAIAPAAGEGGGSEATVAGGKAEGKLPDPAALLAAVPRMPELGPAGIAVGAPLSEGAVVVDLSILEGGAGPGAAPLPAAGAPGAPIAVIYFAHGSARLSGRDRAVLRDVAALQRQNGFALQVVGHASMRTGTTDPASHEMLNRKMSLRRAEAVARALERLGVPAERVGVAAAGDSRPVYHEFMPTGEAGNRRVEIYFAN